MEVQLSDLSWRADPIVRLEKTLGPLVQDLCFFALTPAAKRDAELIDGFQEQIRKAIKEIVFVQSDVMLPMEICLTPEEVQVSDSLITKLDRLAMDLPGLFDSGRFDSISTRLQQKIAPAIAATLDVFRARFIGTVLERQADHRKAAEAAQNEIREISRSIFYISINASVESARAGEHGRGFAVISKEIRDLAQRAQASLRELT